MNFIKTSGAVATGVVAASLIVGTFNLIASKMSSKSDDNNTPPSGGGSAKKKAGRPKKSNNSKAGK